MIVLIITIIIMLILVAISINAVFGKNGLVIRARETKIRQELATIQEQIDLYVMAKEAEEKTGLELYPVLSETMEDRDDISSLSDSLKRRLLSLANTVEAGEIPNYEHINYGSFYKIDVNSVPAAEQYMDLYLYVDSTGYRVISIKGVELGNSIASIIIPWDNIGEPEYILTANNTYKLYGDGTLKVIGQLSEISSATEQELGSFSGVQQFTMPEQIAPKEGTYPYFSFETAYVIDSQNRLWAWGDNTTNKLGLGHSYTVGEPIIISENVAKVWAGASNTWVLGTDNKVYAAGSNLHGTLGQGNVNRYSTFVEVGGIEETPKEILCSVDSSSGGAVILCEDGRVYGVGRNPNGALGLGDGMVRTSVVRLPHLEGAKKLQFTGHATFMLKQNGEVWACGSNTFGRLGVGGTDHKATLTRIPNIENAEDIDFYSGQRQFIIKTALGEIYITGFGKAETNGSVSYDGIPRKAGLEDPNITLSSGGLLFLNGRVYTPSYNATTEILDLVLDIKYESYTTVTEKQNSPFMPVFKNNGNIYMNNYPNITAIGKRNITNLKMIFGDATFVQGRGNRLNIVTSQGDIYENLAIRNEELTNVRQLISSSVSTYAVTRDGTLYAKGHVSTGGWGDGFARDNFVAVTTNGIAHVPKVKKLYTSSYGRAAVFITEEDQIYWMGAAGSISLPNIVGEISITGVYGLTTEYPRNITGNGSILPNIANKIKDIQFAFTTSVGTTLHNTLILTEDGKVYTMSSNNANVSGNGSTQNDFVLLNIANKKIVSIGTETGLCMAVTENGEVYAWGYNYYGLMGDGYEVGEIYPTPQKLNLENIKQVKLTEGFAVFIGKSGEIYGIGRNEYGQLGDGTTIPRSVFVRCTELER